MTTPTHKAYKEFKFTAGDAAFRKWLEYCDTPESALALVSENDMFSYALHMNSIYTQKYMQSYYKKLAESGSSKVNDIVIQIGIAINIISNERSHLDSLRDDPKVFTSEAQAYITHLLDFREYMRGWLNDLQKIL